MPWSIRARSRLQSFANSGRSPTQNRSRTGKDLRPVLVGVTGGIGSGKSTVCRFFEEMGRPVLSTDEIARSLLASHRLIRSRLISAFGPGIIDQDVLDKKKLASIAFRNRRKLRQLNSIIHPFVLRTLKRTIRMMASDSAHPFVVVESALIFEAGLERAFDYVILVRAPMYQRVGRVAKSRGISAREAKLRARNQAQPSRVVDKADFIISNTGSKRKLRKNVRFLDSIISRKA